MREGLSEGHGDRYIGSLFRADESVPDDSLLGLRPRRWLSSSSVIGRVIRLYHDNSTTSLLTMVSLSSSGMSFVSITFYILISTLQRLVHLVDAMVFRAHHSIYRMNQLFHRTHLKKCCRSFLCGNLYSICVRRACVSSNGCKSPTSPDSVNRIARATLSCLIRTSIGIQNRNRRMPNGTYGGVRGR